MKLTFNGRKFDTEEYHISFDEGCRVIADEATFRDIMLSLNIEDDDVDFSFQSGEDGLPESKGDLVNGDISRWVEHYNSKVLEPYSDKETNVLLNELGEEGIQLLYVYQYDPGVNTEENEKQFSTLQHLFTKMTPEDSAYEKVKGAIRDFEYDTTRSVKNYILLKLRYTDTTNNEYHD